MHLFIYLKYSNNIGCERRNDKFRFGEDLHVEITWTINMYITPLIDKGRI